LSLSDANEPEPKPGVRELASGKVIVDEPADHVARITISNPDKRGALDHEILDALAVTLDDLDARCVVITGDGPVFSAGYDIGNLEGSGFADNAEKLVAHPFTEAIEAIERYRYPVIAAINGHAIGGGLELAISCDLRIAARGIKVGMPPAKLGLIYSHTGLKKFIETCGVANTNELFYLGRNVDADRALQMGLVNRVVERGGLEEQALKVAREIGANAPLSLSGNKTVIRALREHPGTLPDGLEAQLVELREGCFRTEDFREGVRAFGEKRDPEWKGR
jgi:enoyl-CoA hydratase/carnithine racemase